MGNIIDYAGKYQESMNESEFSREDGLVLSLLAYIHWNQITGLRDEDVKKILGNDYDAAMVRSLLYDQSEVNGKKLSLQQAILLLKNTSYYNTLSGDQKALLDQVLGNPRYKDMYLGNFENQNLEKPEGEDPGVNNIIQYAVMTFTYQNMGENEVFIANRGTDNTLEGWCEDFLMGYETETWAQQKSLEYLERISKIVDGKIRMGGHSKGGNEAKYQFLFSSEEIAKRIVGIYSYDGPGFNNGVTYHGVKPIDSRWDKLEELMEGNSVAPYDSVIGNLLKEQEFYYVDTDTDHGMFADHDAYSWVIGDDLRFVHRDQNFASAYLNDMVDDALKDMTLYEKKVFLLNLWRWVYLFGETTEARMHAEGDPDYKFNFDDLLLQFKEQTWTVVDSIVKYLNRLGPVEAVAFMASISKIAISAVDNVFEKLDGYSIIRDAMLEDLKKLNIHSLEDLWNFVVHDPDPLARLMDLAGSLLMFLIKLPLGGACGLMLFAVQLVAEVLAMILGPFVGVLAMIIEGVEILCGMVLSVIAFIKSVLEWLQKAWDTLVNFVVEAVEFVEEKICEFIESAKHVIQTAAQNFIADVAQATENIVSAGNFVYNVAANAVTVVKNVAVKSLKTVFAMSNPILYGIARAVSGANQPTVTVDMGRLQNAVDSMESIANRVAAMDRRLDSLYGRLALNNIEQGEGIFTSLINMYNLCRADIYVDQGYTIRRKANAIKAAFYEYDGVEKWVMSMLA